MVELDAASSATEASTPSTTSEEPGDEPRPETEVAGEERDDGACIGAREPERADHEEQGTPAATDTEVAEPLLRCARCKRPGVETHRSADDGTRAGRAQRARPKRSGPCTMTQAMEAAYPIARIKTSLERARCRQPARIERMKQSLATHGQLTALLATTRPEGMELVDGFKRLAAATTLGWPTLLVVVRPFDETSQWAAMLLLNRGPSSMTTLEEALVLRELVKTGSTLGEIASLCARHKSWVSRRIGLVERLHPELVEAMKLGMLHPGSARRLLSLPPGNQLEMAAAVQRAKLGPRDTELLVSLWRRTKEPAARRALLSEPRASLTKHHPETRRPPVDPRLSAEGRSLCRSLHRFESAAKEASRRLPLTLRSEDLALLSRALGTAEKVAFRLATELGSARTSANASERDGSDESSSS